VSLRAVLEVKKTKKFFPGPCWELKLEYLVTCPYPKVLQNTGITLHHYMESQPRSLGLPQTSPTYYHILKKPGESKPNGSTEDSRSWCYTQASDKGNM